MNPHKLSETVLLQIEAFWVLQEIDESWRQQEPNALKFLESLYVNRSVDFGIIYPVLRISTTISTLFLPIAYTSQATLEEMDTIKQGLSSNRYDVIVEGNRFDAPTTLRVFRNSVAHLPDFMFGSESPNISFDEGVLCCRSRSSKLVFNSEEGFINFIGDLLRMAKAMTRRFLEEARLDESSERL